MKEPRPCEQTYILEHEILTPDDININALECIKDFI